ncbi:Ribophorin I-domain-containing protein [Dichotomocladium elegans]|nr:Ribophorin I-domain-containing protein [Dichotomocladium elegans]
MLLSITLVVVLSFALSTFDVEARNVAVDPVSEYYFRFYPAGHLAHSSASITPNKTAAQPQQIMVGYEWDNDTDTITACLNFAEPIQSNDTVRFRFKVAHIRALKPTIVAQQRPNVQWVRYKNNMGVHVIAEGTDSSSSIIHGPLYSIASDTYAPLVVKFEFPKPLMDAHRLIREVRFPNFGQSVKVEECLSFEDTWQEEGEEMNSSTYYSSTAAGEYGQLPYVQQPDKFLFQLPASARDIYCRDRDGKLLMATEATTPDQSAVITLHCVPRQPPVGRNYTLCHGYHENVVNHLVRVHGQQRYTAHVALVDPLGDISVDQLDLRVLLPYGGVYPVVESGYIMSWEFETSYTRFRISGRTVMVLSKSKVIQAHAHSPIHITFEKSYISMAAASASTAGMVAILGIFVILVYRIYFYSTELPPDPEDLKAAILHLKKD